MLLHQNIALEYFYNANSGSNPALSAGQEFAYNGSEVLINNTGFPDTDFLNFLNAIFRRIITNTLLSRSQINSDILTYLFNNDSSSQNLFCSFLYCPCSLANSYYFDGEQDNLIISQKNIIINFTDINLYDDILDNSNVYQTLNGLLQIPSPQLSDDDYKLFMAVESYNKNYLLYHQNDGIDVSSNDNNVDLSTINSQLTKIADSLNVSVESDPEDITKSITEVLNDKQQSDLIQVNTTEYPIDFKRQSSNSLDFTE